MEWSDMRCRCGGTVRRFGKKELRQYVCNSDGDDPKCSKYWTKEKLIHYNVFNRRK